MKPITRDNADREIRMDGIVWEDRARPNVELQWREESATDKMRMGWRRSRVVTFTAIRLRGPGFKPWPGQKFENENLYFYLSYPSGGEGVSPVRV